MEKIIFVLICLLPIIVKGVPAPMTNDSLGTMDKQQGNNYSSSNNCCPCQKGFGLRIVNLSMDLDFLEPFVLGSTLLFLPLIIFMCICHKSCGKLIETCKEEEEKRAASESDTAKLMFQQKK